ncbi:hypothetical protein MVLG_01306 [Microbotryum lychnidis-dioicae p1A1 Lamole]|uniref:Major facilitator superfamily (MFS) profile domain-containing protein n=1 Tax=Microbotryum lychnidis-dioicae (strain p1A1 Lamole / MvSl-1064) TaxID=683840 RepID=U5H1Q3_USTV1|nr:hypothetical protein MVLG_01306 [Microbotryum lychnidis-dioicae p1A1 Lamole]|eukprot:KDE08527.1 hypothetical protein MVLG_01306 [Microbotryum lychnidis-dioicae p1A1 Lamole]
MPSSIHSTLDVPDARSVPTSGDSKVGLVEQLGVEPYLDVRAETALRRKIDRRVIAPVFLMCLFSFIDRANVANARIAGMEKDLQMTGIYDFNLLVTSFYIGYLVTEIPGNYLCKIFGPSRFLPCITLLFGIFSVANAFAKTFGQMMGLRFILGVCESALIPGSVYYMSRWYRKDELAVRIASFSVASPVSGAFGGLLASGLIQARPFGMVHSWRLIFFAEGFITISVSIMAWFVMTASPETATWLSADEKELAVNRVKSENVGATTLIDKASKRLYLQGMFNKTAIVCALLNTCNNLTGQGQVFFLPSIVKSIYPHRSVVSLQLFTVPPHAVGICWTLGVAYLSYRTRRRAIYIVICSSVMLMAYIMFIATLNAKVRYAACFLIGAVHANAVMILSWTAINTTSETARAGALALNVLFANLGGVAAGWTFIAKFGQRQIPGNVMNLCTSAILIGTSGGLWWWQAKENYRRDEKASLDGKEGLSKHREGMDDALLGQTHPDFRFFH